MHEFSVMSYLLGAVEEQANWLGARKVLAINLVVGERAGIMTDSLSFYFDMLAQGMAAEGAQLNVRYTPMCFHCAQCGGDYAPKGGDFACPSCLGMGQIVDDGSDLLIESIEIET